MSGEADTASSALNPTASGPARSHMMHCNATVQHTMAARRANAGRNHHVPYAARTHRTWLALAAICVLLGLILGIQPI